MTTPDTDTSAPAEVVAEPDEIAQQQPMQQAPAPGSDTEDGRDRDGEERGRPVGQWVAAGGSGLSIAGTALYQTTGIVGLAAGAVVAAGGGVAYGAYRLRGRSAFGKGGRTRQTTSRIGSAGRTSGPKFGKGGPKLFSGGKGGPKLGGGKGGPKLGGGKGGPKLGGKAGKRLGGGKGSTLGGKTGVGPKGRRSTSRLGSVGSVGTGGRGRGVAGRAGNGALSLAKRGGKSLGAKGQAGLGRWSKSTNDGAGLLGSTLGRAARKAARKTAAKALGTKVGQRRAEAFKAAQSTAAGAHRGRWAKLKRARAAAKSAFGSASPFARWSAGVEAGLIAILALAHGKWRARRARRAGDGEATRRINDDVNDESTGAPLPPTPTPDFHSASGRPIPTRRTHPMNQFPLAAAASEIQTAAARYQPENMWQVDLDFEQIHDLPLYMAQAIQIYTQNLQAAYPVNPVVIEALGRMYVALGEIATSAQELPKLFKDVHADDIKKKTAPRIGEDKWNV
jgi:hypothetical protein